MKHFYALLLWGVLLSTTGAQLPRYHAQVFGPEQGIGGGGISDIFKDRQQFLWIVGAHQLQRFDGRNVRTYPFEKNIPQAICAEDNRVWVLSGRKVWRHEPLSDRFVEMPFDTSGGVGIAAIFQLRGQPVCVLTSKGIRAWQEPSGRFETLGWQTPAPRGYTNLWRFDTCGPVIFYPHKDSLVAFNTQTGKWKALHVPAEIPYMRALTPDLVLLSQYDAHTFRYDFARGKITRIDVREYGLSTSPSVLGVTGAASLGRGIFLLTSRIGVLQYDLVHDRMQREHIYAGGKPLELSDMLARIFRDENGVLWAHNTNNVVAFDDLNHGMGLLRNYHYEPDKRWSNRVAGMTEDKDGNLWFCGANGFTRLSPTTGQTHPFHNQEGAVDRLSHASVRGIDFDGKYLILGPTDKGIWMFDPRTERFRRPLYASDSVKRASERDFIDHLRVLRNGDVVVAGRFHPYCIRAGNYRLDFISFPGNRSNTNVVYQDTKGRVWMGTNNGTYCLDEQYRILRHYPSEAIASIHEETENTFLLGTLAGLRRLILEADSARVEKIAGPFEGRPVTFLFPDRLQRWWIGSTDGLFLSDATLSVFKRFDFADNIQGPVFNGNACFRARNDLVFFCGINGINYLYPEKIAMEDHPLSVSIQSMCVGDRDSTMGVQPGETYTFPYQNNTLTFEVVAPYFNNAAKVQYRYRLAGFSENWISMGGGTQIRLAELPPGAYRLEVAASITGEQWYPAAQALAFTILPPFWQTWPFRVAALALLLLWLWVLIRYRENRLKKRQQTQLELEKLKNTTLQYQLETEQVVNYFSRSIASQSTVDEALWSVARQCIARLDWEDCVIYMLDHNKNVLVQKAAWGKKSTPQLQIVNPIEIPLGKGIVGTVAQTGQAELVADTSTDPRYIVDDAERGSEIAVPIIAEGRVIGVIDSEHTQKHFYSTWHLQLLTAIASLCSNKIVLAQTEEARQRALLEALDNQRKAAEAKLQSMRLQMNPHFLFNALNSIQQMTLSGKTDGAALYLSKFSKLLRLILTHSDHDEVSLREETDMLQLYLELESLRFDDTFTYIIACENGLDKDEYRVPTLLIQPFVENAIWHGLLHKEGLRKLQITFSAADDDALMCTVEDNGIGRAAARLHSRSSGHSGKGTSVGAERLRVLNQKKQQHNTLEIIDLHEKDGSPAGTRVCIRLYP